MNIGFDKPLYLLPFDHRHSYESDVFHFEEPLAPDQIAEVAASKQVIYDGYRQALAEGAPQAKTGILVDEVFGAEILRDAKRRGYTVAMPTEKSGQHEFDFQYGDEFEKHIDSFEPTFVKALVRFNAEGDAAENKRQAARLKRLSDYAHKIGAMFMFELLVPAEKAQLAKLSDPKTYDTQVRPGLMARAISELQQAGVEPDVWKVEGLDRREDCEKLVATARAGGRDKVGCIVLGRGEDEKKVIQWLQIAAGVPGFIGFAVGRSTFLQPIIDCHAKKITHEAAATEISRRFREWIDVFEQAKA